MTPAKKDPEDLKTDFLKIRVTADRLERWRKAAADAKAAEDNEDLDFSAWVRRALNTTVDDEAAKRERGREAAKRGKGGGR